MNRTAAWALSAAILLTAGPVVGHASELDNGHGSITVRHAAVRIRGRSGPGAVIRSSGALLIGGRPVPLTAAQRILTLRYYADVLDVAAAGKATGKAGGWMALKVIGSLFSALWHDDSAIVDRTAHAQQVRLQARLERLCRRMSALQTTQNQLADAQAAFAPYAYIRASDVAQCFKDAKDAGH